MIDRHAAIRCVTNLGAAVGAVCVLWGGQAAVAQVDQTWINGNATWDTTSLFWDGGVAWSNGNNAILGGAGEVIGISGTVAVNHLTFGANGFTLADPGNAGTLTFAPGSVLTVTGAADTATISEALTVGGIDKQGAGTLVLSGANGYDGVTTVTAGRLVVRAPTALGSTVGSTQVVSGAQLTLADGVTVTGESLSLDGSGINFSGALQAEAGAVATWAGPVSLTAGARIGAEADGVLTISGAITGTGLTLSAFGSGSSAGTLVVGSPASYSGSTSVIRGVLRLGVTDALPVGTSLNLDSTSAPEDSILDLAGFNQTVGSLQRSGAGSGAGGSIITNSGAAASTLTVNQAGTTTFSGVLQDGVGVVNLTKTGAGSLTLEGANTHSGETRVSEGALVVAHDQALGSTAGLTVVDSNNARIVLANGVTVTGETARVTGNGGNNFGSIQSDVGATATWAGDIELTGDTRMSGGTGGTLNLNGVISGPRAVLFSRANDATTVLNAVNTYTGDTQLFASAGSVGATLKMGVDNAISPSSKLSMLTAVASQDMFLDLNGHKLTLRGIDTSNRHDRGNRLFVLNQAAGPAVLTLGGTDSMVSTNVIADGGGGLSLVKEGAGTQTLLGISTYTGSTTVRSGVLQVGGSVSTFGVNGSLASTELILEGGTLALDNLGVNNNSGARLADAAAVNFNGGELVFRGSDQAATNSTETVGSLNFESGISLVSMTFGATNTATLTAGSLARPVNGGLGLVNGGNLGRDAASGASVSRVLVTAVPDLVGGTDALPTGINASAKDTKIVPFLLGVATATTGGLGVAGTVPNTFVTYAPGTGLRPLNPTDEFTLNTVVAGDNVRVTSDTTAAATTNVNSLLIENGADFDVAPGQTVTVDSGAILFASGSAAEIGGNTVTSTLNFGAAEGLVTINSTGNTFIRPAITGSGGMSFFGSGTYIPGSDQSTYTGDTLLRVNQTIPVVDSIGPAGAPTSGPFGRGRVILDGSAIRSTTTRDTVIANELVIRADTTILATGAARSLVLTGPVTLEGGDRVLTQESTANTVFSGVIGDGGNGNGLTVAGGGTGFVVLEAANTFTGPTVINSSGLHLASTGSLAAGSAVTVNGGTLSGSGAILGTTDLLGGVLRPGESLGADTGVLSFGDRLGLGGVLLMDIHGLSRGALSGGYDALDIPGDLTYGGSIVLNFPTGGYVEDDFFDLFDFSGVTGSFTDFAFTGSYTGNLSNQLDGTWSGMVGGTGFRFTESTGVLTVIPEPSRVLLVGMASLMALLRRRRTVGGC